MVRQYVAHGLVSVVPLLPLAIAACSTGQEAAPLSANIRGDTIILSVAPAEFAVAHESATVLVSDLEVGGAESDLAFIADVAPLDDRSFWVLDRMSRRVVHFTPEGKPDRVVGREGRGPGEFRDPWALTHSDGHLIIWERGSGQVFTVLGIDGSVRAVSRPPVSGDWLGLTLREPVNHFEPGMPQPPEDITWRLQGTDNGFLYLVREDEVLHEDAGAEVLTLVTNLVHFDLDLNVVDTVVTLPAPAVSVEMRLPGAYPKYTEGHFPARGLWAVGDDWVALHAPGDSSIRIMDPTGNVFLRLIRWNAARLPITDADRRAYYEHWVRRQVTQGSPDVRKMIAGLSEREFRETMEAAVGQMETPEMRPELMALYGAGQCVWLAGFNSDDRWDGVGLRLVAISVDRGRVEWDVRLPAGSRVRAVSASDVFASHVDDDGVVRLVRYPLPDRRCHEEWDEVGPSGI